MLYFEKKQLHEINSILEYGKDSEGFTSYIYDGTVKGFDFAGSGTINVAPYTSTPSSACDITVPYNTATLEFANYGSFYGDLYKSINLFKKYYTDFYDTFNVATFRFLD